MLFDYTALSLVAVMAGSALAAPRPIDGSLMMRTPAKKQAAVSLTTFTSTVPLPGAVILHPSSFLFVLVMQELIVVSSQSGDAADSAVSP